MASPRSTILHSLSNSCRAVSFWDGVSSMSFCTSFPNRGRRCIFPFAYIPIGRGGFAHFSAKNFKKIFQRHKKSLENRNQAEKYRPYTAPKAEGIRAKERKGQHRGDSLFSAASELWNLRIKVTSPIMVQDERLLRGSFMEWAVYTTSLCAPEKKGGGREYCYSEPPPMVTFQLP